MSEAKPFASLSSGLLARKGAARPAMRRPNFSDEDLHSSDNGQDDLGWNDMGYDVNPDVSQEIPARKSLFNPLANAIETPKPEVKQQQERIAAQLQASNAVEQPASEDKISDDAAVHGTVASNSAPNLAPQTKDGPISSFLDEKTNVKVDVVTDAEAPKSSASFVRHEIKPENKKTTSSWVKPRDPLAKAVPAKAKAAFTLRLDRERHLKLRLVCAVNNISAQKFVTDALDQRLSEMEQINRLSDQISGES